MDEPIVLRALGWDHPRCRGPMEACAAAYRARARGLGVPLAGELRRSAGGRARRSVRPRRDRPSAHRRGGRGGLPAAARRGRPGRHRSEPRLLHVRRPAVGAGRRRRLPGGRLASRPRAAAGRLGGGPRARSRPPRPCRAAAAPRACALQPRDAVRAGGCAAPAAARPAGGRGSAGAARRRGRARPGRVVRLGAAGGAGVARARRRRLRAARVRIRLLRGPRALRPAAGRSGRDPGRRRLAVTAASLRPLEAQDFALWCVWDPVQIEIAAAAGGQPASRAAWYDDAVDAAAHGYYSATRAAIEGAWTRPRDAWWPRFQRDGGRLAHEGLRAGRPPREIAAELARLL